MASLFDMTNHQVKIGWDVEIDWSINNKSANHEGYQRNSIPFQIDRVSMCFGSIHVWVDIVIIHFSTQFSLFIELVLKL